MMPMWQSVIFLAIIPGSVTWVLVVTLFRLPITHPAVATASIIGVGFVAFIPCASIAYGLFRILGIDPQYQLRRVYLGLYLLLTVCSAIVARLLLAQHNALLLTKGSVIVGCLGCAYVFCVYAPSWTEQGVALMRRKR